MYRSLVMVVSVVILSACFKEHQQDTQNLSEDMGTISDDKQSSNKEKIKE